MHFIFQDEEHFADDNDDNDDTEMFAVDEEGSGEDEAMNESSLFHWFTNPRGGKSICVWL